MKYEQVEKRIYEIIFRNTGIKIQNSLCTFKDMGINSLEYIKILVCIEEQYGIDFTYEYYENFIDKNCQPYNGL